MRGLRETQQKNRKTYLCRMKGECPMPGKPKKKVPLEVPKKLTKVDIPDRIPKSVKKMKKLLSDLKEKRSTLKKEKKELRKLKKAVIEAPKTTTPKSKPPTYQDLDKANALQKDYNQFKSELFSDYEDNS